ncbi:hypothetical protein AB0M47_20970 [Hamadaea sp. NPDC051192]|uniref:hypothetical protein n=1 Tax=Hamadaea sp. NPDC051192 TaxID=3154940 RepID=UPI00341AB78C
MPYDPTDPRGNRRWLHKHLGSRIRPEYADGQWTVARAHLRHVVGGLADRFGVVHVYLDHLEQQKCDTRCVTAERDDCVCQCGGENHRGADYQRAWIQVGDTTLVEADPATVRVHKVVYP